MITVQNVLVAFGLTHLPEHEHLRHWRVISGGKPAFVADRRLVSYVIAPPQLGVVRHLVVSPDEARVWTVDELPVGL